MQSDVYVIITSEQLVSNAPMDRGIGIDVLALGSPFDPVKLVWGGRGDGCLESPNAHNALCM